MKIIITITTAFSAEQNELHVLRGRETKFPFDGIIFQILVESFGIFVNIKYAWILFESTLAWHGCVSAGRRSKWKTLCCLAMYFLLSKTKQRILHSSALNEWADAVDIVIISRWTVNIRFYNMDLLLFFSSASFTRSEWNEGKIKKTPVKMVLDCLILHIMWKNKTVLLPFVSTESAEVCIPQTFFCHPFSQHSNWRCLFRCASR